MKREQALEVMDLFCGAGGFGLGFLLAAHRRNYKVRIKGVNHDAAAIATWRANHPDGEAYHTGIDDLDPRSIYKFGELFALLASPACTHHSRARGGVPMNDQSRNTAWCVIRWAESLQPNLILVENVPEFMEWGPLGTNGRPLKSQKGRTFNAWISALGGLGYKVDYRVMNAADYGPATTRSRLFIQAVRGRRAVAWPKRTHAPAKELCRIESELSESLFKAEEFDVLKPWTPARKIIDWNLKGRWLDEMRGKKKYGGLPLSPKTLARIHAGLKRYGLKAVSGDSAGSVIIPHFGERPGQNPRAHSIEDPLPTVTGQGAGSLLDAYIVPIDHTGQGRIVVNSIDRPLSTVTTEARHGLAEPFLIEHRGTSQSHVANSAKSLDQPIGTITTSGGHHSLLEGLVVPDSFLVPTAHGDGFSRCHSLDDPLKTICGNRDGTAFIEPHLLGQHSCAALRPVSEPAPTITTDGAIALIEGFIEGEAFLTKFYGTGTAASLSDPLDTVTTKDRFGLVMPDAPSFVSSMTPDAILDWTMPRIIINGRPARIRLRWRMLQPHELAAGMSFPKDYIFPGNKTQTVKQIGNAVCPELIAALCGCHL